MNAFENRRWLVIPVSITGSIDFGQVLESSPENLRLSVDETQTFVKYDINIIEEDYTVVVPNLETGQESSYIVYAGVYGRPDIYSPEYPEYNHQEILELLSTPEWTQPLPTELIK
jgi:hypothetical protein